MYLPLEKDHREQWNGFGIKMRELIDNMKAYILDDDQR